MKHFLSAMFLAALAAAPLAFAQKWEVGAGVGGAFYTSQTIQNAIGNADASRATGLAFSAWLGNNSGNVLGGELRYDYENGDLNLKSGGTKVSFASQSNAVHYDFLLHLGAREASIRPFLAAGAGVKVYSGTGKEVAFQPLSNIGLLTKTSQLEPLVSVGGGVKFHVADNVQFRVEIHDYLTPFPKNVIAPSSGSKLGGWLSDFVVMAGLSFTF
jgi:opacity protein-like surface antigen